MHRVDVTRGEMRGELSAQWARRPDDQRFLNLTDLYERVSEWADLSREQDVLGEQLQIGIADHELAISLGGRRLEPTHYAFGQLANWAKVPASYLRQPEVPAALAAACLRNGLAAAASDDEDGKGRRAYLMGAADDDVTRLRAMTGPRYGRILDRDVVGAVREFAGNGTGDCRWKVPGQIDWSNYGGGTIAYDPEAPNSLENTTLYASDRDVWMFLCDDRNPIEVGKLANGDPDLMFRGFYAWNSEVGARTFGVAAMYLRAVCCNRNLWGVEGFHEITIRHSESAPQRFLGEAVPALTSFAEGSSKTLVEGVQRAKAKIVATDDEERVEFLQKFGFSKRAALAMIAGQTAAEGEPPASIWDFGQAITAAARAIPHAGDRVAMEQVGEKVFALAG